MNIVDALSGSAGLEGIQWMFTGAPRRALRRELSALLAAPNRLGLCHLRRAQFKPGRKLMAYYDAHFRAAGDGSSSVRPVFAIWGTHRDETQHHTSADLAAIEDEAVRRSLSAPFRKLTADTPDLRMHLQVSPMDVSFPQLPRACDPRYVRDMVAGACAATNAAAPAGEYSIAFIRYRPGQRHVLRYDPLDAPDRRAIFAKLYSTREEGERVFRLTERVGEWLAQRGDGVTCVRPLACVAEDAIVLYPQVLGTPLSKYLRCPDQSVAGPLKSAGAALYALHQLPQAVAGPLELHDFTAEVEEIARTSEHVSALLPPVGATLKALLERAQELYERLPQEPPAFTYKDFKGGHVWITPGGLTLIDLDGCHMGDPALDVGKFLADLRFWCAIHGHHELRHVQEQFLAGYGPGAPAGRMVRARLYEAIELLKESVRRVRMFEPDWACRTERLIGCGWTVLNDLQRSLGLPGSDGERRP